MFPRLDEEHLTVPACVPASAGITRGGNRDVAEVLFFVSRFADRGVAPFVTASRAKRRWCRLKKHVEPYSVVRVRSKPRFFRWPPRSGRQLASLFGLTLERCEPAGLPPVQASTSTPSSATYRKRLQFFKPNHRPRLGRDDPLNLSISLSGGKETNRDSLSNGE